MPAERRELAARVGVGVFLSSWAMVFAALLFSHLLLDTQRIEQAPPLPIGLAGASTAVLLLSTLVARTRDQRWAALVAAASGLVFVGLQVVLWSELWARGLWPQDSQLASSLYALTGFHAAHVVIGIGGLLWTGLLRPRALRWWRMYWDFVLLAWLAIFAVGFLL
jgi:heme/copper-type cytochrome/quinol oxidase subunit 3